MLANIKPIAKAVVAIGGAVVATAAVLATGNLDLAGLTTIIVAWLTALGVYQVPNAPKV
jgi:hypothetical protein